MNKINSTRKIRQFSRQKGAFLLAEMSMVAVITSMGVATALIHQKNALQTERYQAQGELLKTLSNSLDSYIASNYIKLTDNTNAVKNVSGETVGGTMYGPNGSSTTTYPFANIYAPTVSELVTAGFLPSGFSSTALVFASDSTKASYKLKITPTGTTAASGSNPATSNCPNCNLQGLAYLDKPVRTDEIKELGVSVAAIGANGLYSIETNTDAGTTATKLYGRDGLTNRDNPADGTPAGILAASTDYSTSGLSNFMRIDGSVKPTGNQDWNAKSLTNVGSFSAGTGTVSTTDGSWTGSGVRVDSNGNIYASGTIYGTLANTASTASLDLVTPNSTTKTRDNFVKAGAILVSNGSGTVGDVGSITATGVITGGSFFTAGTSGTTAISTTSGNITSTSGNIYAGSSNVLSGTGTGTALKSDGTIYASGNISSNGNLYTGSINTTSTTSPSGVGAALRSDGSIYASGRITGAGGLNANNAGIINTGPITGATSIDATGNIKTTAALAVGSSTAGATGTITASGLVKGAGIDASNVGVGNAGPITGATTITASGGITGQSFTTTTANGGINTNGGIIGTSLYIGQGTPTTTNGTTTTGVGLSNTGTLNIKNSDTATASGTTIFNITNVANNALVSIKNWTDNVTNAVLAVLGTIKATGGDIIAKVNGGVGGNVIADTSLQLAVKGSTTAASHSTGAFASNGGWFVSSDNYMTSLNGKSIWTNGDLQASGKINTNTLTIGPSSGANVASIDSTGAISGTSVAATGNITSSGGYIKGALSATRDTNCSTIGAIATDSSRGAVTCQMLPSGVSKWRDHTVTMYTNTATVVYPNTATNTKTIRPLSNAAVDCPTGYVMTGVQSTGTSGSNITQIRCSPVYQGSELIYQPS